MAESCPDKPSKGRFKFLFLLAFAALGSAFVIALPFLLPFGGGGENPTLLFAGRFHPLVVHFPIGALLLVALFEVLAVFRPLRHLRASIPAILVCSALGAALAVGLGCLLASGGGDASDALSRHLWTGVALAVCLFALLPLHHYAASCGCLANRAIYQVVLWSGIGLLGVTSHLGGNLVHGPDYLVKYMPDGLRQSLFALPQAARDFIGIEAPPPTGQATIFADIIAPAFDKHCTACHIAGKAKGGLRMDTLEHVLKGGGSGPGVTPGQPDKSEILRRVTLPHDDDEFMPPDGKKPMPEESVAVLKWWIESGKAGDLPVSALEEGAPAGVLEAIRAIRAPVVDAADAATAE